MPSQFESKFPLNTFPNPHSAHTHMVNTLLDSSCCGETSWIPACAFNFVYNNAPMQKAYQKLFKLGLTKTESLHFFSALNFALLTYLSAIGRSFWKKCFKISIYYQQEAMDWTTLFLPTKNWHFLSNGIWWKLENIL